MTPVPSLPLDSDEVRRLTERIRSLSRPREPQVTGSIARLVPLGGIRAVLCDVYGTLLCAGCGEIDAGVGRGEDGRIREAFQSAGIELKAGQEADIPARLEQAIREEHARLKQQGVEFPEVRIDEIWERVLGAGDDRLDQQPKPEGIRRLALEHELRVNPVWPMPGAAEIMRVIAGRNIPCGIISNAQFYTPLTLAAFDELGWPDGWAMDLCVWSYIERWGKPGLFLFQQAVAALARRGIAPHETLYIGNDLNKDIRPAKRVGFRTVLFAGDAGSLRLGDGTFDEADAVVTHWRQLLQLFG